MSCQFNRTKPANTKVIIHKERGEFDIDQIVFGKFCRECGSHCATMYKFTMNGNQNSFSADYSDSYFFTTREEQEFATSLNDAFHFKIGQEIASEIPKKLLNSKKGQVRFGCPDCEDGCGMYLEINRGKKVQQFLIDYQTSELDSEIRGFAEFLKKKIVVLNSKDVYY